MSKFMKTFEYPIRLAYTLFSSLAAARPQGMDYGMPYGYTLFSSSAAIYHTE